GFDGASHDYYYSEEPDTSKNIKEGEKFPKHLMVYAAVAFNRKFPLVFCENGIKINSQYYQDAILQSTISYGNENFGSGNWVFIQDSAPSHRSKNTQEFLCNNVPFISASKWPSCSPDLNPLDYCIWGMLKHKVYSQKIKTLSELKTVIEDE
ncbi:hypothetical protein B4U79_14669, partial [Dinothrombium tinctorium]